MFTWQNSLFYLDLQTNQNWKNTSEFVSSASMPKH